MRADTVAAVLDCQAIIVCKGAGILLDRVIVPVPFPKARYKGSHNAVTFVFKATVKQTIII